MENTALPEVATQIEPGHVKPRIQQIEERIQSRVVDTPQIAETHSNELVPFQEHQLSVGTSNLKHFESEALKRQAEHSSRISDLEGRLALFHARLAKESAERGREHAATMDECINAPLEGVMSRSLGKIEGRFVRAFMDPARADGRVQAEEGTEEKKESNDEKKHNLVSVERRINLLEAQMNHHQHITLFHSQKRNFDSFQQQARTMLEPALALESTKADKREGALVRRFEASAGEYTRLLAEIQASRASSLGIVQKEIDSWKGIDESRAEHFLSEIRSLKDMVRKESEERKRQDDYVLKLVDLQTRRLEANMLATT